MVYINIFAGLSQALVDISGPGIYACIYIYTESIMRLTQSIGIYIYVYYEGLTQPMLCKIIQLTQSICIYIYMYTMKG